MLGPLGTGGLYLAPGFHPEPLLRGGTGSLSESEEQPDFLPDRYEAGTLNLVGLAGLLAALDFLEARGPASIRVREASLCERLLGGMLDLPGVSSPGPEPGAARVPVVSLSVEGHDLGEIGLEFNRRDIALRVGLHCAAAAHRSIGTFGAGGTLRFSPGFATSEEEIDVAIETLEAILT
jgi:selenocysteine lyase/cysteine desulfurase